MLLFKRHTRTKQEKLPAGARERQRLHLLLEPGPGGRTNKKNKK